MLAAFAEHAAVAPEGPAHVGHRHEERGRQAVAVGDLDAQQGGRAAEAHGPDAQAVALGHDLLLELGQARIAVAVVQLAEELLLRSHVARAAVAADAHAQDARPAALALGLQHRVEQALAHALEVAPGAQPRVGQAVLDAHVLAAAALEHHAHGEGLLRRLVQVELGAARAQVVARVLPGDRVHRVLAQVAQPRGLDHGPLVRLA